MIPDSVLSANLVALRSVLGRVRRHLESVRCSAYIPHRADDMKFVDYYWLDVYVEEALRAFDEHIDQKELLLLADEGQLEAIEYDLCLVKNMEGDEKLAFGHLGDRNRRRESAWAELQWQRKTCEAENATRPPTRLKLVRELASKQIEDSWDRPFW